MVNIKIRYNSQTKLENFNLRNSGIATKKGSKTLTYRKQKKPDKEVARRPLTDATPQIGKFHTLSE